MSQKCIYFCFIDYAKVFDWVDHQKKKKKCGKFLKDGNNRLLYFLPKKLYAGQDATETDIEQLTGSKLGKESVKAVYCYPAYLTYLQSTSCEMLGWMKHNLK